MDEHEDITEQLETENQMLWVHIISNIANRAREIINSEIIHTIIWLNEGKWFNPTCLH